MPTAGVFAPPGQPLLKADLGNVAPQQQYLTVATSQTINAGDLVSISGGLVSQAIALPGSNNTVTLSGGNLGTLGVAMSSVTTDSSGNWTQPGGFVQSPGKLLVQILDNVTLVALQLYDATLTNTPISNLTQYVNYQYGRYRGANANTWWYVISKTTTNGELKYIEQWPLNDIPTASNYGWGWFKAINTTTVQQG